MEKTFWKESKDGRDSFNWHSWNDEPEDERDSEDVKSRESSALLPDTSIYDRVEEETEGDRKAPAHIKTMYVFRDYLLCDNL